MPLAAGLQLSDRDVADRGASAEEQYNYTELNALLMQGISKMPPQRQLIFRMSRYEHLSNREIAERLGLSVRTVDKHIELALKDLHSSLFLSRNKSPESKRNRFEY